MTRRVTTSRSVDAHDSTKELLKSGAARAPGRHRAAPTTPVDPHLLPGPAPVHRARKPRTAMPKL